MADNLYILLFYYRLFPPISPPPKRYLCVSASFSIFNHESTYDALISMYSSLPAFFSMGEDVISPPRLHTLKDTVPDVFKSQNKDYVNVYTRSVHSDSQEG